MAAKTFHCCPVIGFISRKPICRDIPRYSTAVPFCNNVKVLAKSPHAFMIYLLPTVIVTEAMKSMKSQKGGDSPMPLLGFSGGAWTSMGPFCCSLMKGVVSGFSSSVVDGAGDLDSFAIVTIFLVCLVFGLCW